MNKDIKDKEAFAQKIAQMEDSGLTPDQKKLVEHVEQAIETNQSNKKFKNEYEYIDKNVSISPYESLSNSTIKFVELFNDLEILALLVDNSLIFGT